MSEKELVQAVANGVSEGMTELVSVLVEIRDAIRMQGTTIALASAPDDDTTTTVASTKPKVRDNFKLGDKVVARLVNSEGKEDWYEAELVAVNDEGNFTIKTQDDGEDVELTDIEPSTLAFPDDDDRILAIETGEIDKEPKADTDTDATEKPAKGKKPKAEKEKASDEDKEAARKKLLRGIPYKEAKLQEMKRKDLVMLAAAIHCKNPIAKQGMLIRSIMAQQKKYKKEK